MGQLKQRQNKSMETQENIRDVSVYPDVFRNAISIHLSWDGFEASSDT